MSKLTGKAMSFGGTPCFVPNDIAVDAVDYYVSYNNHDTGIYGSDTTALVLGQSRFYILDGDHTENYKSCASLGECLVYFESNEQLINKYSETLGVLK